MENSVLPVDQFDAVAAGVLAHTRRLEILDRAHARRGDTITVATPQRYVVPKSDSHDEMCVCGDCAHRREKLRHEQSQVPVSGLRFAGVSFRMTWTEPPRPPQYDPALQLAAKVALEPEPFDAEYATLARSLGLEVPQLLQAELEAFLAEEGLTVYPIASVVAYMNNLMRKLNETDPIAFGALGGAWSWHWKPLGASSAMVRAADDDDQELATDCDIPFRSERYAKAIPYPVLLVIQRIRERFGDRVGVFISDYDQKDPDPFLMVSAPGLPAYVIERWDEPAFRP